METRQEHKANKTGFAIFSLSSKKFYIKSCEQVAPLKTTPHKESNKIWFDIFRAVYK